MNYNEATVFKWLVIIAVAVASVIALTLLTRPLIGSLWGLVLLIAFTAYGIRWAREWWHNARDRPGGPDYRG